MKYQTGGAFRRALEQRLRNQSFQTGVPLVRLRKMIAFDRFLARLLKLQPKNWVVKGGLALQLRLGDRAHTTMDIDVLSLYSHQITSALREAGSLALNDWFSFEVAAPTIDTDVEIGVVRHTIRTLLDGRTFERFHADVGMDDPLVEQVEYLQIPALLGFADLKPTNVPCYPVTQQIAEKLHTYTRPRISGERSRVKDFIDILLLADIGTIDGNNLRKAIRATFSAKDTHPLPTSVPTPPSDWSRGFTRMAHEVGLADLTLNNAYQLIQDFLYPVLTNTETGTWDRETQKWR